MILKNISIINYKNIRSARIDFSPKINCFIGSNGVGKTNLLDAIYYLSFCHSCFSHVDAGNISHGEDFFAIDANYLTDDGENENVNVGMKRGQRKHFRRNKKEYKRYSEHIGLIPLIFISPSDNILVDGSGEERRKLMDTVISQIDSSYLDALMRYNKALQQRNALLKLEQEPDAALMEIWEQEMATQGERIYKKRDAFVKAIIPVFQTIHQQLSGNKEQVSLRYVSHCQRGPLLEVIQRDRFKDRAVGYSLHGIHRDDLEMLINDYPLRREGSQGQTKTFVLALKLAQFDILRRTASSTTPLLLLDDIFDKLDAHRVEQIVNLVEDDSFGQIFITDTNRDHLDQILKNSIHDYSLFDVKDGEISLRKKL
ncbi:MAG: DNA replication/repair protein RecF [Prevotella sp.]|jgi:DNA replication and repair protein RecF